MNTIEENRIPDDDQVQTEEDARVIAAVEEYLAALQNGHKLGKREFLSRFPEIAETLAHTIAGLDFVHQAGPQLKEQADTVGVWKPAQDILDGTPLGDYRFVREIGRGGMGVVYEAEQLSLGRRVALKILPFAAALDPKQIQRFQNEARAAAWLRHPHIVAVHGVGCERGVHYYAMDYIEGRTLADVIHGLRQSTGLETAAPSRSTQPIAGLETEASTSTSTYFRTAAALAAQAADALSHAHEQGIVHRDIKPANLLVDQRGAIWVTDFGLSRVQRSPGLTLTGEVMGTLRYMSPEQALGHQEQVDHRTDIYSLGATLYELLGLAPALPGGNRQELLQQLATVEPRLLRKVNRAAPVELETILLKAMAKDADERYASARDFADDLQRYLEDKPVLARRPTLVHRFVKWTRRHRTVVAAAIGLLLLAVIGLAVSTARIAHEERRTRAALADAQEQRQRALAHFSKAMATIDQMLDQISHQRGATLAEMQAAQRKMMEQALSFYEGLCRPESNDVGDRFETGQALMHIASVQSQMTGPGRFEPTALRALDLFQRLAEECPGEERYVRECAAGHLSLGANLMKLPERQVDAERHLRQAIALLEPLAASSVSCQQLLVESFHHLGYQLQWQYGRAREAEDAYRRCLQFSPGPQNELDQRMTFAAVSNSLGLLLRQTGRPRQAVEAHESALGFLGNIGELGASENQAENERARAHFHLSLALWELEQRTPAVEHARTARAAWRQQAADYPLVARARLELAGTLRDLGRMLELAGEKRESEAAYREGLELPQQFAAGSADAADGERLQIVLNFNLGRLLLASGRYKEADELLGQIVKLEPGSLAGLNELAWLLTTFPEPRLRNPARAVVLAGRAVERAPQDGPTWNTLGVAHFRAGQDREARAALEKSMELRGGGDSYDWYFLAQVYGRLGERERAMHWYNEAVAWMNKNKPGDNELLRFHAEAAAALGLELAR